MQFTYNMVHIGTELYSDHFEPQHVISNNVAFWQDCVNSDEPVQPPFKLRNSKWSLVSSLILIEYSSDLQRLWSDCTGWSESLLVAQTTLLEISCRSSFVVWFCHHQHFTTSSTLLGHILPNFRKCYNQYTLIIAYCQRKILGKHCTYE